MESFTEMQATPRVANNGRKKLYIFHAHTRLCVNIFIVQILEGWYWEAGGNADFVVCWEIKI